MAPEVDKQPKPPRFERLALIGVGLIGSSIARATKRADLAASIVGCARTPKTRDKALELGIVDAGFRTLANNGPDAHQEVPHLHIHIFAGRDLGRMIKNFKD